MRRDRARGSGVGDGDSHRARPASRATELGRRLRRGDRGTPSEARTGQGGGVLGTEGAGDSHDPQRSRAHTRVLGTRTTLGFLTEKGPHAPAVWASLRPCGGLAQAGSLSAPPAPAPPWASSLPPPGPSCGGASIALCFRHSRAHRAPPYRPVWAHTLTWGPAGSALTGVRSPAHLRHRWLATIFQGGGERGSWIW